MEQTQAVKKRGGARPGAGRKPKETKQEWTEISNQAIPADRRVAILNSLATLAESGDLKAIELTLAYLYGKPSEKHVIAGDSAEPISMAVKVVFEDMLGTDEDEE